MIAAAGAGPNPIPHKLLTANDLAGAIKFCLQTSAISAAQEISARMSTERGVNSAVQSFHANLPFETLRCDVVDDRPATWTYKKANAEIKLSNLAAQTLIKLGKITQKDLKPYV